MELDDFKATWQNDKYPAFNPDINKLFQKKDDGPVAALKKVFIRKLIVTALVTCNLTRKNVLEYNNDIMMWAVIFFASLLTLYYYYSYNILDNLQTYHKTVNDNIKNQITLLQRRFNFYVIVMQLLPLVFMVLLEVLLYHHQEPFFAGWYKQPLYTRLSCYTVAFIMLYVLKRITYQHVVTRHMVHLKQLAAQL